MSQYAVSSSGYKRTTDKQYSLLTHEMSRVGLGNRTGKNPNDVMFWNTLTQKLNALGPPYRTVQQWKKVWTDFKRFHSKRNFRSTPKFTRTLKNYNDQDHNVFQNELDNKQEDLNEENDDDELFEPDNKAATSSKVAQFLRSEWEDYEQNSQSMQSNNSIEYDDEYTYPDRHSGQHSDVEVQETLIPDETPYEDAYAYAPAHDEQQMTSSSVGGDGVGGVQPSVLNQASPPPLRPSNTRLLEQTLYTLQNQMEHQTKLLEHLSQISSTMASLMERQVHAVEKQTEAMRRQATATEHHTLVMNNFVDMIKDKMPKPNLRSSSSNLSNGSV